MAAVQVAQESFEGALMLAGRFVVLALEFRVANVDLAVLAPVFRRGFPVF